MRLAIGSTPRGAKARPCLPNPFRLGIEGVVRPPETRPFDEMDHRECKVGRSRPWSFTPELLQLHAMDFIEALEPALDLLAGRHPDPILAGRTLHRQWLGPTLAAPWLHGPSVLEFIRGHSRSRRSAESGWRDHDRAGRRLVFSEHVDELLVTELSQARVRHNFIRRGGRSLQ